jgi:fatty acid desaturase
MEESFEHRPLLDRDLLRVLQKRHDFPSALHIALQLGAFGLCIWLVVATSSFAPAAIPAAVLLGAVWASLFAPFHEFTHQTPFRSRRLNLIGAWLTGIPFGMTPTTYREFHFAHHRFTHDPEKDPELGGNATLASWPANPRSWFWMITGLGLLWLKIGLMFRLALLSSANSELPYPWDQRDEWARIIWENRLLALVWTGLAILTLVGVRGAGWVLVALIPCHVFQSIWLTTEHTGLPFQGTILNRTRTVYTSAFIRWWLWNMNYHAEHHAWPAIPWHALPLVHQRVADNLEHESWGYWRLQLDVLHRNSLPDGGRPLEAEKVGRAL